MARQFFITTMGCQMNEYDSDYLGQLLLDSKYEPAETPKSADLILINTCAVRAKAEQKAFSLLGRMLSLKERKPSLVLGLVGCIAQQEGANLIKRFPGLDFVLGTREIGRIGDVLTNLELDGQKSVATEMGHRTHQSVNRPGFFEGRVKSFLSIMEGCNNYCSYCIVPYVRGEEVSRPSVDIIHEAKHLVSEGIKEITLLGQNVNSYASPTDNTYRFPSLLKDMAQVKGLDRIRFTTSHPKDLSEDLIQCFDRIEKLCAHIHLPVQAGSDRILKLMNRRYTRQKYLDRIQSLREVRPDIAITTDIIVGFPGEKDEDFKMTLDLLKKIEFDNLFSFKYSDRKGTLAENMENKIDEKTKRDRLQALQTLQKSITRKKNRDLIGKEVEILVEGTSKKGDQLTGRTETNKIVNFNCDNNIIGNLIKVKILRAFVNSLSGNLVRNAGE